MAAAAHDGGVVMLYELRPGPCDRSFGIHCAKMANFPEKIIQRAVAIASTLESFESPPAPKSSPPPTSSPARSSVSDQTDVPKEPSTNLSGTSKREIDVCTTEAMSKRVRAWGLSRYIYVIYHRTLCMWGCAGSSRTIDKYSINFKQLINNDK